MTVPVVSDKDVRKAILRTFYDQYLRHGLHVIVLGPDLAKDLRLEHTQARRCLEYLAAKGMIKPMTLGGGYSPTVSLVDEIESEAEA